jgi:transcriptional regulator with XRE-family HTH domain
MINGLGNFLKDRRTKLDAARLGYPTNRRRTRGLRREEVAQRADVSTVWYTWLEQGRGGPPSADVLERLARALNLTDVEREHLFLLAQNRPPEIRSQEEDRVTPQLQRIMDALDYSPAYIKTPEWDVIAGNRAAGVVFSALLSRPEWQRNLLRMVFDPEIRTKMAHWEDVARFVVATLRAETAKTGFSARASDLVEELTRSSAEFERMWLSHDVVSHGEGTKFIAHPDLGAIALEFSAFAVDGQPRLTLVIYNPTTERDKAAVRALVEREKGIPS